MVDAGKRTAAVGLRELGGAVGNSFGNRLGGRRIGAAVSRFVGFGAYGMPWSVSGNSVVTSDGQIPQMTTIRDRGFNVKHTEFLGFVNSTTGFNLVSYPLQPGNSTTFPWLANIAENFSEYRMNGAVIVFKSSLTDAVATFTSMGTVSIACDMNVAAAAPSTFVQMEQLKFVMAVKPSVDGMAPVECDPRVHRNQYFVRAGPVPGGASINDYDHANIFVATYGMPTAGVQLGRLYITYDVDLMEPKLLNTSSSTESAQYSMSAPIPGSLFAGAVANFDNIGINVVGANTLVLPSGISGVFEVDYLFFNASAVGVNMAIPTLTYTNCALSTNLPFPTSTITTFVAAQCYPSTGSSTNGCYKFLISKPSSSGTATVVFPSVGMLPVSGNQNALLQVNLTGYYPITLASHIPLDVGPLREASVEEEDDEKYPDPADPSPVTCAFSPAAPAAAVARRRV